VPADAVLIDPGCEIMSNESALTGEPEDLRKRTDGKDPFLLSSCLVTSSAEGGQGARAMVIGTGMKSQWGKIKANLVSEATETPLQEKLGRMAQLIGYLGVFFSIATFVALVAMIWAIPSQRGEDPPGAVQITRGFVNAFVLGVTIVVVAIPEGLPLAVTIALAYSTKKMYKDKCFIRILAACETMGNATTICSDKTGTLTENRMTVVDGWFGGVSLKDMAASGQHPELKQLLNEQVSVNRTAYFVPAEASSPSPLLPVVGSKTEGAMMYMVHDWGFNCETTKGQLFDTAHDKVRLSHHALSPSAMSLFSTLYLSPLYLGTAHDKVFPFNSVKKRSSAVVKLSNGTYRLYTKGASELLLKDCSQVRQSACCSGGPTAVIACVIAPSVSLARPRLARHGCQSPACYCPPPRNRCLTPAAARCSR